MNTIKRIELTLMIVTWILLLGAPTPALGAQLRARNLLNTNGNGNKEVLQVNLEDVPIKTHRIAAQLLQDQVEKEEDVEEEDPTTWTPGSKFDPAVRVLYRLGMKKPAYYEFRVSVGTDGQRNGYIIVSSGDHDFPVPHWNTEGPSPTEMLDDLAGDDNVGAYYKLDLTYVAEDEDGNIISRLGNLPMKFESDQDLDNLADNAVTEDEGIEGTGDEANIFDEEKEDSGNRNLKGKDEPFERVPWGATDDEIWQALKADGGNNSRFLTKSKKKVAAEDWETEQLVDTYGEGLFVGQSTKVALLFPDAKIHVSGRGAKHVSTEVELDDKNGYQVLNIVATEADEEDDLPFRVRINYGNGRMEDNPYTIIPLKETPDNRRKLGSWSPWTFFYADHGQRMYGQYMGSPNTSSCYTGCGATAWAMLFGWVDYRASFDSKWSHRWCAYRQNGWWGGKDAVAPYNMDAGAKLMAWKIRNEIGTYCDARTGRTKFSNMLNAYKYLQGTGCGWNIKTSWNNYGYSDDIRNKARDHIVNNKTPVIISDYDHYPLAYGYAWRKRTVRKCFIFCWNETQYNRSFKVNNGWASVSRRRLGRELNETPSFNIGWISATTYFAGRFYP